MNRSAPMFAIITLLTGCVHLKGNLDYYVPHPSDPSSEFRVDGIYLRSSYLLYGLRLSGLMIFHRNGVVSCETTLDEIYASCEGVKKVFATWSAKDYYEVKEIWGAYKIEGDEIRIQVVIPWTVGIFGAFYRVGEKQGMLLNDTSFVLKKYHVGRRVTDIYEVYSFHPCDFRPDSSYFPFKDQ